MAVVVIPAVVTFSVTAVVSEVIIAALSVLQPESRREEAAAKNSILERAFILTSDSINYIDVKSGRKAINPAIHHEWRGFFCS